MFLVFKYYLSKISIFKTRCNASGVFSFSQIYATLKLDKLNIEESLRKEIMDTLIKGGTP